MGIIDNDITGTTKTYGILGYPVSHSFSPVLQNTLACSMGVDMRYLAFSVSPENLGGALTGGQALGIQGLNVTLPHKQAVMEYLCEIHPLAVQIGAVNTLKLAEKGYIGYNTDYLGLDRAFALQNISLEGKSVVIIGAGGGARAAAVLAEASGARKLYLVNRTLDRAKALAANLYISVEVLPYEALGDIAEPDILIQTTSVGMDKPEESPVADPSIFSRAQVAMDIIYTPWQTRFLKEAKRGGCLTINGFDMLIYQGVASFEIWHNMKIVSSQAAAVRDQMAMYFRRGR